VGSVREGVHRLRWERGVAAEVDGHLSSNALGNALLSARGVAFVGWTSTLCLVNLGALLKAATHAVDGALARLGLRRERAVATAVSLLAETGPVVAVPVLGAIVQADASIACVSRPAGVAVARALNALAVSAATLTMSGAASGAVITTPAVLARAHSVEALSVAGAIVGASLL